jgi:hypothetical protein
MTVASLFRKYNVGCILNYVRLIITREICCIYIPLLLQLCTEVSQVTTYLLLRTKKVGYQISVSFEKFDVIQALLSFFLTLFQLTV